MHRWFLGPLVALTLGCTNATGDGNDRWEGTARTGEHLALCLDSAWHGSLEIVRDSDTSRYQVNGITRAHTPTGMYWLRVSEGIEIQWNQNGPDHSDVFVFHPVMPHLTAPLNRIAHC